MQNAHTHSLGLWYCAVHAMLRLTCSPHASPISEWPASHKPNRWIVLRGSRRKKMGVQQKHNRSVGWRESRLWRRMQKMWMWYCLAPLKYYAEHRSTQWPIHICFQRKHKFPIWPGTRARDGKNAVSRVAKKCAAARHTKVTRLNGCRTHEYMRRTI